MKFIILFIIIIFNINGINSATLIFYDSNNNNTVDNNNGELIRLSNIYFTNYNNSYNKDEDVIFEGEMEIKKFNDSYLNTTSGSSNNDNGLDCQIKSNKSNVVLLIIDKKFNNNCENIIINLNSSSSNNNNNTNKNEGNNLKVILFNTDENTGNNRAKYIIRNNNDSRDDDGDNNNDIRIGLINNIDFNNVDNLGDKIKFIRLISESLYPTPEQIAEDEKVNWKAYTTRTAIVRPAKSLFHYKMNVDRISMEISKSLNNMNMNRDVVNMANNNNDDNSDNDVGDGGVMAEEEGDDFVVFEFGFLAIRKLFNAELCLIK
nr:6945_t:CDS:2 [Entrophospora candida]